MRLALALSLASVAVLGAQNTVNAQGGVPYGQYIFSFCNSTTTWPDGLGIADKNRPSCKPVTGLGAAGFSTDVNCVQIDPCNDTVWIGFCDNDTLARLTLDANCNVSGGRSWGRATSTGAGNNPINKICFDFNGDPVVAAGDDVWRFDRSNASAAAVSIQNFGSTVNAVCCGSLNLWVGVPGQGIFQMPRQIPGCSYGPPVLVCPTTANITGCAVCPSTGDVWFTTTQGGSSSVATCNSRGITTSTKPGNLGPQNCITYDPRCDTFMIVNASAGGADNITVIDKNFCATPVCTVSNQPAGSTLELTGVDTDDCTEASTTVLPNCGVIATGPFTMEIGTCGDPGDIYGIFLIGYQGVPLAISIQIGIFGPTGKACVSFRRIRLTAAEQPFSFLFVSATTPGVGQPIVVGGIAAWPGV
jgi:hypothetical protein